MRSFLIAAAAAAIGARAAAQAPDRRIVFSEIHYHPAPSQGEEAEFLELHNAGGSAVDLSAWRFTKGIDFSFPAGAMISAGEYIVLAADEKTYRAAFGEGARLAGIYAGRLDNSGETLRLRSAGEDAVEAEVSYDDLSPWPVPADGSGKSLELHDLATDGSDPFHWRAGGPTPGARNSVEGSPPGIQLAFARHSPPSPGSADSVVAGVAVNHARPLVRAEVKYALGILESAPVISAALRDDGAGGDALAGDGIYSAELPARPNHTLVRYWFEAEDADAQSVRLPDPASPTSNFGYHVYDGEIETGVPLYFLIMEPALFNQMLSDSSDRLRPAALVHDGQVYDRISIRQRGAFARSWPKKSFKVIFNRDRLFQGQKRINLNSGWRDPAFLRELIAYDIHRLAGCLYSNVRVVRLHVNTVFHGAYLEVEQPTDEYLARQGLPDAVWYKADSPENISDERVLPNPAAYARHYEKETFSTEPHDDLHAFSTALAGAARGDANLANLSGKLDLEDFVDYLAANQFTSNWDAFNKNHYFGWDREGTGKWFMGPWDLDRTLGDHWGGPFNSFNLHILLGEAEHAGVTGWNRLFDRFYEHPELLEMYYARLRKLLLEDFREEEYLAWIDGIALLASKDIDDDRAKWNSDPTGGGWKSAVAVVKKYLLDRKAFMLQAMPGEPPAKPSIVRPSPGSMVASSPARLESSDFVAAPSGAAHHSTVWQLRLDRGAWSAPMIAADTRSGLVSIDLPVLPSRTYFVRAAHRDANGKMSAFSDEVSFTTSALGFEPVPVDLSAVFNADVIADVSDPETDPFEGTATYLIADGHDGTPVSNPLAQGIPPGEAIEGYRIGDPAAANVLQLKRGDAAPVEIPVPAISSGAVGFLVSGGAGDSQIEVDLFYETGPPSRALVLCDDWEDDETSLGTGGRLKPELRTALDGLDAIVDGVFADANEFALFEQVILADPARRLVRLVLHPAPSGAGPQATRYASLSTRFHLFGVKAFAAAGPPPATFRRGDADGSGRIDISDPIALLLHLFQGGKAPACPDAADADDSGQLDLTDAIRSLEYLFREGAEPPAPGPVSCGEDVTADPLDSCSDSGSCP